MSAISKQPQLKSKNFIATYIHDGLLLDVFGKFDEEGVFAIEAVGLHGTTIDASALISDELDEVICGWAEFMAPAWKAESRDEARIDDYIWRREMAVTY